MINIKNKILGIEKYLKDPHYKDTKLHKKNATLSKSQIQNTNKQLFSNFKEGVEFLKKQKLYSKPYSIRSEVDNINFVTETIYKNFFCSKEIMNFISPNNNHKLKNIFVIDAIKLNDNYYIVSIHIPLYIHKVLTELTSDVNIHISARAMLEILANKI